MKSIFAKNAQLPSGWVKNILVVIDDAGKIDNIIHDAKFPQGRANTTTSDILLPAPANLHSHAFQRAMAGLTEQRGPNPNDSFWTWRKLMFQFLNQLTPDDIENITAFVQMEMLEAGYSSVGEFHYLHHAQSGKPYDNLAEMSERIAAAASTSGIGLTLLPVHYQYGGCDQRALATGQDRFSTTIDSYLKLWEQAKAAISQLPSDTNIGYAPHSLRAVSRESLSILTNQDKSRPFHMHLAEQIAEVEEVKNAWGARPVEWLFENHTVNERWCLIHCTQMQPHETSLLAKSGAVAGLCPYTESSLGDGIFDGKNYLSSSGKIGIGSDSNIRISLTEELRTFEYSQRLRDHARAVVATKDQSTGAVLYTKICEGGAQAIGRNSGSIKIGQYADLISLDENDVNLHCREGDTILDSWIFAGNDRAIKDVWSAGRHLVKDGKHIKRDKIVAAYKHVISRLTKNI